MSKNEILLWLTELLHSMFGVERDEVLEKAFFNEDFGFDSMDHASLMVEIEDFHQIEDMTKYQKEDIVTVKNVIDFVYEHQKK